MLPAKTTDSLLDKFRNRQRMVKVPAISLRGRQGRTIHDELADEFPPVPTVFEQAFPFEWPHSEIDILIEPVGEKDDAFVSLAPLDDDEVRPPTDDELVDFWDGLVKDKKEDK